MSIQRSGAQASTAAEMLMATPGQQLQQQRAQSPMVMSSAASLYSSIGSNSNRPPSAQSHCTIATAARPGSAWSERMHARPGTPGIGLNIEVKVESRPVTQQGMMSMRTPFQGPGRQILDKSYFLGKLRAKKQELQTEIDSMTVDIDRHKKRGPANIQLENRHVALLKEVQSLKGQLGDYNMVMENVAAGAELEQLKDTLKSLKEKTDQEGKKIEQLFIERSQTERATRSIEETYMSLESQLGRQLSQEGPEKRAKFMEIYQENQVLTAEVERLESELHELTQSIQPLEQDLAKTSPRKQKAVLLLEQLLIAEEELQQMQAKDTSLVHLSAENTREAMLCKIRQDNAEIAKVEEKCRELDTEIKLLEDHTVSAETVINELKGQEWPSSADSCKLAGLCSTCFSGGRAEKFLEMQQKEKKMQSFLDNYETTRQEHIDAAQIAQQKIIYLLEQASHEDCANSSKGTDNKDKHGNHSHDRCEDVEELTQELQLSKGELKQLEEMEAKTGKEIIVSKQKIANLKDNIEKLTSLDEVRLISDSKCLDLEAQKKALEEKMSGMQVQLKEQTTSLHLIQQQLNESQVYKNIETLNTKLLAIQDNVLQKQEELEMKERELNYKPVLENIRFMVGQLNGEIRNKLKH